MGIDVTWDRKERDSDEWESSATQSTTAQAGGDAAGGGDADTKACLPYTAFVVDDVQSIRKLLKRTLLGLGFTRVELFENGKRALDAMKKEVVDVVFMDIQVGGASICAVLLGLYKYVLVCQMLPSSSIYLYNMLLLFVLMDGWLIRSLFYVALRASRCLS